MASTTCTSPLALERLGSRSSVRKPMPDSRPTYAGRRLPGHRGSRQASPRSFTRLWFRRHLDLSDASAEGLLSLVSLTLTSTGIPCTLAPTLTTATVNRSSLGWFDGPLLKVDADGPSHHLSNSFHMVLGHYSFPHMLLRHTGSRPKELHLRPLAERCMSLSTHTAPIRQTRRYCFDANVRTVCAAWWQWNRSFGQPVFSVQHSACTSASPTRSMWH
jgi:hypothetical protein